MLSKSLCYKEPARAQFRLVGESRINEMLVEYSDGKKGKYTRVQKQNLIRVQNLMGKAIEQGTLICELRKS